MISELPSIVKLYEYIDNINLCINFLSDQERKEYTNTCERIEQMDKELRDFISNFSDDGWCVYDSINFELVQEANSKVKKDGKEFGTNVLLEYYLDKDRAYINHLNYSNDAFKVRRELINSFMDHHFKQDFYASIPLGLLICDGIVNDVNPENKGLFASGTQMTSWNCIVGIEESLQKVKGIFSKGRNKTRKEMIKVPFRNGILHGRDVNFANEYVSCKILVFLLALSDWTKMVESEDKRKADFDRENEDISEESLLEQLLQLKRDKDIVSSWEPRKIDVEKDIKNFFNVEEYPNYPYLMPLINWLKAWKNKNYGEMAKYSKKLFSQFIDEEKLARECNCYFSNKILDTFKIIDLKEVAVSSTCIMIEVTWHRKDSDEAITSDLEFKINYCNESSDLALPQKANGEWVLYPFKINDLWVP
ncbi:hypothetical protein D3H64_08720 [Atopobacter sp. AH10]|uniref:hypothetical protein n=1 Tax=Atopobacter sp. AH10 TaxID=2315861 RepID=UPI000EF1F0FC|nr:hypothetical protein [Atopobacter sp. AH10]RLK62626.1 hypothetical protein D3H64_08720 [Atopobacter sp. AH10]